MSDAKVKEYISDAHSNNIFLPSRTIFLVGDIDEGKHLEVLKNLHILDQYEGNVTIYINSEGGEVASGFAIYDAIKAMKCYVRGIVNGQASSIASVILQACDSRLITPNSFVMIHEGNDGTINATRTIQKQWAEFDQHNHNKCVDIYLSKIKEKRKRFSKNDLETMLKTDTILKPEEAVKLGLVDEIINVI